MPAKPIRLSKSAALARWSNLPENPGSPRLAVTPIGYKHTGSTFDCDSIRITGSQPFIDSVLARLSDLLAYDEGSTRLHIMYVQTVDRKTQELSGSWGCYVQVHERGKQTALIHRGGRKPPKDDEGAEQMESAAPDVDTDEYDPADDPHEPNYNDLDAPETSHNLEDPGESEATPVEPVEPVEAKPEAKPTRSRKAAATRYALAYVYEDGDYEWAEPNGGIGCDTYDDEDEARESLKAFDRTPSCTSQGISVVRVRKNGKGKMDIVR